MVSVDKDGAPSTEDVETLGSNSDGKREEILSLAGFDILRFKNNFLEVKEHTCNYY